MMISTRGRYGLRVMLDIAQSESDDFISLKSISERLEISMKYLEMIIAALNKAGLVKSQRGKDGGYKLVRPPGEYSIGEIIRVTEGGLSAVACPECEEDKSCERADGCLTLPLWQGLYGVINDYLDGVSLEDILKNRASEQKINSF